MGLKAPEMRKVWKGGAFEAAAEMQHLQKLWRTVDRQAARHVLLELPRLPDPAVAVEAHGLGMDHVETTSTHQSQFYQLAIQRSSKSCHRDRAPPPVVAAHEVLAIKAINHIG